MQITFKEPNKGSQCNYVYLNADNEIEVKDAHRVNGACHGRPINKKKLMLLFTHNDVMVTEDEFNQWIDFCNSCGFPCTYSIQTINKLKIGYSELDGKYYTVTLDSKDYASDLHLFAAVTVLRMISYRSSCGSFCRDSQNVITNLCDLIEKNPQEKNPLRLLLLAHRYCIDSGHFLICKEYDVSDITVDEMLDNFKKSIKGSLNAFFSQINSKSFKSFKEIKW